MKQRKVRELQRFYNVQFQHQGKELDKTIEASCPGGAFSKVMRKYPGCTIHCAVLKGHLGGHVRMPVVQVTYPMVSAAGFKIVKQKYVPEEQPQLPL